MRLREAAGDPLGPAESRPQRPHDQRGHQRRDTPGGHHLWLAGECDGGGYQHHGVDRRGGEHERQCRGAHRTVTEQAARHGNRAALATGQGRAADTGREDGHGGPAGQPPSQSFGGYERRYESADHDAEGQERNGLHEDTAENRGRGREIC
jgi:hypothetical protein